MSNKMRGSSGAKATGFWFWYLVFFAYVFPLAFSFSGVWSFGPIIAHLSLGLGILGWLLFTLKIIRLRIFYILQTKKDYMSVMEKGRLVQAEILHKVLLNKNKDQSEDIEVEFAFHNLSRTLVKSKLYLTDTKPRQGRFDRDKTINLRLNKQADSPPFVLDGPEPTVQTKMGVIWTVLNILYAVISFIIFSIIFSENFAWDFLTPWFSWVAIPYWGLLLLFSLTGVLSKKGGLMERYSTLKPSVYNRLLLYGKKTTANVTGISETGVQINDQPQIQFHLDFTDEWGKTHYQTYKKIVAFSELPNIGSDQREVLYLADDPSVFRLM